MNLTIPNSAEKAPAEKPYPSKHTFPLKPVGRSRSDKKYPSKQTINLAMKDGPKTETRRVLPALILGLILLGLFLKFGVIDVLGRANQAENQAGESEKLVQELQESLKDYDAVLEKYDNYQLDQVAMGGSKVSAMESLNLIEQYLLPHSKVENFAVEGDVITVKLSGVTLNQISDIYNALRADPLITGVEVYTASSNEDTNNSTACTMTIFLLSDGKKIQDEGDVQP